jgi:dTMP kinase
MAVGGAKRGKNWFGHGLPYVTLGSLPGHLIVIEGTDGVGRSTQIERLSPWLELEGWAVSNTGWTRSPLLSETINEAKAGHELTTTTMSLLYGADFADRMEHQIIPALKAGFIVIADRYMYTVFARNAVMGMDVKWTQQLFGMALVPDLVLYLEIDVEHLIPRVLEGKGMDYWESGMHLALGHDMFESFTRYQTQLIGEYNRLARQHRFVSVDARQSVEDIQSELRGYISAYLARSKERDARERAATERGAPRPAPSRPTSPRPASPRTARRG